MKKYTIQECIKYRIAILCTTNEQVIKLGQKSGFDQNYNLTIQLRNVEKFEVFLDNTINWNPYKNNGYFLSVGRALNMINFDQIDFQEEFILPEKWCVKITEENIHILENYRKTLLNVDEKITSRTGDYLLNLPRPDDSYLDYNKEGTNCYSLGCIEITFKQFEKYVLNKQENMKQIKGYKLIKKYPRCSKPLSYIEPYTTGEFSQYPEFWMPIYEEQTKTLVLGTNRIKIELGRGKAIADGKQFSIHNLRGLLLPQNSLIHYNNVKDMWNVTLLDARYKIGCSEFTLSEIKQICDTYDSLNK